MLVAKPARRDLETLTAFIETGQLIPVIERTYALADTAKALSHLAEQHARSKLVIAVPAPAATTCSEADERRLTPAPAC